MKKQRLTICTYLLATTFGLTVSLGCAEVGLSVMAAILFGFSAMNFLGSIMMLLIDLDKGEAWN